MKQGWEIKKLKEGCRFVGGYTPSPSLLHTEGHIPYFKVSDMNRDGNSRELYHTELYLKEAKKTYPAGAIVFPKNGGAVLTNKKRILVTKSVVDLTTGVAIPNSDVNVDYLYYFFCGVDFCNFVKEGTLPVLKIKEIGELPIFLPHLEEQERIGGILDREFERIDALKANAEQNLQHAKDLFQSALKQELQPKEGWVTYRLQDVCTEYGDYGMSLSSKPYDGIRYLRITDITEWGDLNNEMVSADTDVVDERYILREGDILFARTGATVGKTLVYNESMGCCSYAGYLIRYRLNQSIILPLVMYYITHSKEYYEWIVSNQKSATLPNISAKLYNSYEICIPKTLTEQNEMISRLGKLKAHCKTLEENYTKTIALCDDMKQALLRKAFNGEL